VNKMFLSLFSPSASPPLLLPPPLLHKPSVQLIWSVDQDTSIARERSIHNLEDCEECEGGGGGMLHGQWTDSLKIIFLLA